MYFKFGQKLKVIKPMPPSWGGIFPPGCIVTYERPAENFIPGDWIKLKEQNNYSYLIEYFKPILTVRRKTISGKLP